MRLPDGTGHAGRIAGWLAGWLLLAAASALADDASAILTLSHNGETRELSLEQIETGERHAVTMCHPEGPEGTFSGVWLDDFLAAHGLDEARRVRFIAHDDYTTFLTPAQRRETRYLLVTRLDGEPIGEEALGPLMLIAPAQAQDALEGNVSITRWIWAIRKISAR